MSPETRARRWRVRLATWGGAALATLVVCAAPAAAQAPVKLAGTDVVGSPGSSAQPGGAEVYRTSASASGTARYISLFLDQASTADRVTVGLYADEAGQPTSLLTTGSMSAPVSGDWNHIAVAETSVVAGRAYWIAMLNPADSAGALAWRDRAGGTGGGEQTSARGDLTALPAEWETGTVYSDGPLSAYVSDRDPGAPLGLVGAWSFDETSGTTAGDASGFGNAGLITGATRALLSDGHPELEPRGAIELRGRAEPVRLYTLRACRPTPKTPHSRSTAGASSPSA